MMSCLIPQTRLTRIGDLSCGAGHPLLVIAGPCVIDEPSTTREIAHKLKEVCGQLGLPLVFKASFDKANRSSGKSWRGPGMNEGLRLLASIRDEFALPVTTDIHESNQAEAAAEVCDLLQIPAFLARQTDLLLAAAGTGKAVNVKKGQFMAPADMRFVVDKLDQGGCQNTLLTERGTFFGYGRLVNDFGGLVDMRSLGVPVAFDATHSVQNPGGATGVTGGNRNLVPPLARAAMAVGVDAVFLETHPEPAKSPSDAANIFPLDSMEWLLRSLQSIDAIRRDTEAALQTAQNHSE